MCNSQGSDNVCASTTSLQNINSGTAAQIPNDTSALLVARNLDQGKTPTDSFLTSGNIAGLGCNTAPQPDWATNSSAKAGMDGPGQGRVKTF